MTKKRKIKDPFAKREAKKYENPIPSRECIMQLLETHATPLNFNELAIRLDIEPSLEDALNRRLIAMLRDKQVWTDKQKRFAVFKPEDLIAGFVTGHPDGYGFVTPEDGTADLYLSPREMRAAFHNDSVLVQEVGVDRRGRREAKLVRVVETNTTTLAGRFYNERGVCFVVPDNKRNSKDVLIKPGRENKATNGQIVLIDIIEPPKSNAAPIGAVIKVLGAHMAAGMEVDLAIHNYELPCVWPKAVTRETKSVSDEVKEKDKKRRDDLRDLAFVTIDGEDAQDFDDAVFAQKRKGGGWRLLVAIADVSHYVTLGSALDNEAYVRGTSVYFPNRVIPMLPEVLSNGLCSLKPNVDRLSMVCDMHISEHGKLTQYSFYDAVIQSHARLTYTQVAQALANKSGSFILKEHSALLPHLDTLFDVYKTLLEARNKRGAIEFTTTETKIEFGTKQKIKAILPVIRNDAHRLIEECMLAANVCAANFLLKNKIPSLFRVHIGPNPEKFDNVKDFLNEFGLQLPGGKKPSPMDYAKLLQKIEGRPDFHLIQSVLLKSFYQAVYSPENIGHFGLAYDAYAHFTSPIRRYPDLLVHRAIRHILTHKGPAKFAYSHDDMADLGKHCSMTERRADQATYDVIAWLECEFMLDKVGETFDGIISAVTGFGFFVELAPVYIEGLVHVTSLANDFYHFDPVKHQMVGERSKKTFRLGDKIKVDVAAVSIDERKIDLTLTGQLKKKKQIKPGKRFKASKPSKSSKASQPAKQKKPKSGKKGKIRRRK